MDNYDANFTWKGVYFLHGDMNGMKHYLQKARLVRFLAADEWPEWPSTYSELNQSHCGCRLMAGPFGPADFWYRSLSWFLSNFVRPRDASAAASLGLWMEHVAGKREEVGGYPLHNGTLKSPQGAMFAVDHATALMRSRTFYHANYRMAKYGVRVLDPGKSGAPRAARRDVAFDYNPLVWGHVNERLAAWQFGRDFVELPIPDCIWHGDHATMNCTQLVFPRGDHHLAKALEAAYSIEWSPWRHQKPTPSGGQNYKNFVRDENGIARCKPFDNCGSFG